MWYWGDLHTHSGWSWDGCELPAQDCAVRQGTPGADFFANADEEALDFAALTDHAEADVFYPDGLDGDGLDIWSGQAALVLAAQSGSTLPLLGYEWTAFRNEQLDGHERGSHRTVLLSDASACEDYRIQGWQLPDGIKQHEVSEVTFTQERERLADTPGELWAYLAAVDCAPVRWLTYAHHPAYRIPQVTDWLLEENRPDHEQVVEIYSEHGASECADPDAEGCDWRINDEQGYYPDGAVQTALEEGYWLGFVGGTDSHDARPGSLSDGPSSLAHWLDTDSDGIPDTPKEHFTAGGLTGIWLDDGQRLDEDALFDAIASRHTAATSGPRPTLQAAVIGQDGIVYPPGHALPFAALPADLHVALIEPGGEGAITIERIGPDGVLSTAEGAVLEDVWRPGEGQWTYLRIRYIGEDEERVWLSPWFVDSRSCQGCSSGQPHGGLAVFLALLLLYRRSRLLH